MLYWRQIRASGGGNRRKKRTEKRRRWDHSLSDRLLHFTRMTCYSEFDVLLLVLFLWRRVSVAQPERTKHAEVNYSGKWSLLCFWRYASFCGQRETGSKVTLCSVTFLKSIMLRIYIAVKLLCILPLMFFRTLKAVLPLDADIDIFYCHSIILFNVH